MIVRQCIAQKVIQLKEAIDICEQQLIQDLDFHHTVNVYSLQTEYENKNTVVGRMRKLQLFIQE